MAGVRRFAPQDARRSLAPRLDLRQSQSLVMTPQLRQAIKLLQSSNLEVAAFLEEELERNPLLERDERPPPPGPDAGPRADPIPPGPAPADCHAAALSETLPAEAAGRLAVDDAVLASAMGCAVERVMAVRARMQRFDPVGMFCRDLRECLAVQLAEQNRLDPAMRALLDNLDLLAKRERAGLMRLCGVDAEDLADMVAEIRRLDPKPGASFDAAPAPAVVPDLLMRRAPDGGWVLELNPDTLPRVLVNRGFHARALLGARSREDRAFLTERLQSANWLLKSLEQRAGTILKVAVEIVGRQEGFFRHGV